MEGHAHGVTLTHQEAENLRHTLYVGALRLESANRPADASHLHEAANQVRAAFDQAVIAGREAGTVTTAEEDAAEDAADALPYEEYEAPLPLWKG